MSSMVVVELQFNQYIAEEAKMLEVEGGLVKEINLIETRQNHCEKCVESLVTWHGIVIIGSIKNFLIPSLHS